MQLKIMDPLLDPSLKAKDTIFRIYRDVRFSKNKEPYKSNFGASISKGGRKSPYAGYYMHLEPGNSFLGGGIYKPPSNILKSIRLAIYNNPKEFSKIINNKKFKDIFGEIHGEKLKSHPRGFDNNFEYIDLLKHKSYAVLTPVKDDFWLNENTVQEVINVFKRLYPFVVYLNNAISKNNNEGISQKTSLKNEEEFMRNNFDI